MSKLLTRKELYEMVWEQPVTKVAAELEISDVAVAKICRKHNIPVPGRGYWAKVAAGKRVKTIPLPKIGDSLQTEIHIRGGQQYSNSVQAAIDQSKVLAKQRKNSEGGDEPVQTLPSSYIEKLKIKLSKSKTRRDGFIRISAKRQFTIAITPECIERAINTLENITDETSACGYKIKPSENGLAFLIDSELINFTLTEALDRIPHQPTDKEKARLERWETTARRKRQRGEWVSDWDKPEIPEYDHVAKGRLVFEFAEHRFDRGLRRRFADGKRQRIEKLADRIVTSAAGHAAAAIEGREEEARWKREWEEREKRRQELERRQRLENKRWEYLKGKMERLEIAVRLERFVTEYRSNYPSEKLPSSCKKLLRWASSAATEIRSEINPERLAATLDKYKLMDDYTDISSWTKIEDVHS